MRPARLVRGLRFAVLAALALTAAWLVWRFDKVSLPARAESPLLDVPAGSGLIVDRHPRDPLAGDVWLFRGPRGELLIGRVAAPPAGLTEAAEQALAAGAVWLTADRTNVPAVDSRLLGPIADTRLEGRVVWVLEP